MQSDPILRIAGTVQDSIVDGPGLRFVVFTQGCPHHCPGCHNPETHDPNAGKAVPVSALIEALLSNPLTDGLTLSGGDPFLQAEACLPLAQAAKANGLTVWAYTGYIYETLTKEDAPKSYGALLSLVDVLVDGPFHMAERSLSLPFRGSINQRLIDVPKSLRFGAICLWTPPARQLPFTRPES